MAIEQSIGTAGEARITGLGKVAYPFLGLMVLLSGMVLRGPPVDPDVEFTKVQTLGVFLVFLSFAMSVVGWGAFACQRLGIRGSLRPAAILSLGTAISSVAA